MAVSLINIPPVPLRIGTGVNLRASQIGDCVPLSKSPASVTINVDWANYGASSINPVLIDVDLAILAASNPLDKIRSIYIDNTFSRTPVYVYFQDTQFTVVCPPFSVCMSPVWTNGLKLQLFATSFDDLDIPTTTFQVSNLHVNNYNVIGSNNIPPEKRILRTDHKTSPSSGAGSNTQTFLNNNFGVKAANAIQFIGVHVAASGLVSTVTANGNNCPILVTQTGTSSRVAIASVPVDLSGLTNVTVVLGLNGGPPSSSIDIFGSYNLDSSSPLSTVSLASAATIVNLGTSPNGIAIAASTSGNSDAVGFTGIENSVKDLTNPSMDTASAFQKTIGGAPLGISVPSAQASTCWAAASFS